MHKLSLVLLAICLQASDIRISEVMSNPQGSEYENEFIEIYNASNHVIQINGWVLSDGSGVDTLWHSSGPTSIQSQGYALILDPGYSELSGPYVNLIPDSIPIYSIITDGSFGSGGLSNSGEMVWVYSPDTSSSASMNWTSSTTNGYSWERVSLEQSDSVAEWRESLVENGTPGFRNSVTRPLVNLSINHISVIRAVVGERLDIAISLENTGENAINGIDLTTYLDENQNGVWDVGEWETSSHLEQILFSDEITELPSSLFILESGVHKVEVRIILNEDEVCEDDSLRFQVNGSYPRNALAITEIMYSPLAEQGGEWFEIQNISSDAISIQEWSFSDANQSRHPISASRLIVSAGSFLTLCASESVIEYFGIPSQQVIIPESWPALNSSSDSVRLYDANGFQIAAVFYRGTWGKSGVSLERRNPSVSSDIELNWAASIHPDGGTPSGINTQQLLPLNIQAEEIGVSPQGLIGPAQVTITMLFRNMGMDTLETFEVQSDADIQWFGNLQSLEVDSLEFTSPMLWPGYSNIPIRVILNEFVLVDTFAHVLLGYPENQIAINEIHYLPGDDQVEFLEFINISGAALNLQGWSFQDRSSTRGTVMSSGDVQPEGMFLVTPDSGTLADWAESSAVIFELSNWPSLNNSSDSIIVFDPSGHRQLQHYYIDPIEGDAGRSLERLALWKPAVEISSWDVCQNEMGISPGVQNSVNIPPVNIALAKIDIRDSLLWIDESFQIELMVINRGAVWSRDASIQVELSDVGISVFSIEEVFPDIAPGDSLQWFITATSNHEGWLSVVARIGAAEDDIPEDNQISREIYISGYTSPVIINELMPLPLTGEGEWIELYNRSDRNIDLKLWSFSDDTATRRKIADSSLVMAPSSFLVLCGSEGSTTFSEGLNIQALLDFPTLNNTEDGVRLFDPQGVPFDAMLYNSSTALMTGRSLERIRPQVSGMNQDNWGLSIDRGASTPGFINSLFLDVLPMRLSIELGPNPFSPDGDGRDDELAIQYELPFEQGIMSVMVFDMAGRKIAAPVQNRHVSHRGQVSWDGEASYGGKAVTGLYIMKLLFDDSAGKVWSDLKKVYLIR